MNGRVIPPWENIIIILGGVNERKYKAKNSMGKLFRSL